MERLQKLIDKEQRFKNNIQNKVIERTTKTLKEKQALVQLLANEYKVDNFITMKTGFDVKQIETKRDARHYIIEARIFNSGFNTKSMKPEITRQLRKLDPNRKYRVLKKRLLAENRSKNVEMNRAMSNVTFYNMLKDKNNWLLYNQPSSIEKTGSGRDVAGEKSKATGDMSPEETDSAKKKEHTTAAEDATTNHEIREKGIILEKRLSRRPPGAFSMTMRTLGPVYFQSSSYQLPKTETVIHDSGQ